jgi:hypothetical protein
LFSTIVGGLLVRKYPAEFEAVTKNDVALSALIQAGKPYYLGSFWDITYVLDTSQ